MLALGLLGAGLGSTGPAHLFTPEPYADAATVRFANGTRVDTRIRPGLSGLTTLATGSYLLVHVSGPVRTSWLRQLEQAGAMPVCYIANQTIVCRTKQTLAAGGLARLSFIDWLGRIPPEAKLAPGLVRRKHGIRARPGSPRDWGHDSASCPPRLPKESPRSERGGMSGIQDILVVPWPGEDANRLAEAMSAAGADVTAVSERVVRASMDAARVREAAALEPVQWIQTCDSAVAFNSDVQWVLQVGWKPAMPDTALGRPIWQHGIRGQDMVIGLFDGGISTEHDMFVDPETPLTRPGIFPTHRKIAAYKLYKTARFGDNGGTSFHGSAVAGTLAGNDSVSGNATKFDGIAPDCRIYFVDNAADNYIFDSDLTELLDSVRLSAGMPEPVRQVSGSFGTGGSRSYYLLEEATLDAECWQDREFFVVWAAGNYGQGTYNIGHPSGAKNCLTVGGTGNGIESNLMAQSSSGGPMHDGRFKPNLVAPGEQITTVDGNRLHGYELHGGTSYSAPATSGALLLLRQYFNDGWYPSGSPEPGQRIAHLSSALMRALAVCACDTNVGEDYVPGRLFGWGRIDLSTIMHFAGDSVRVNYVDDSLGPATGEYVDHEFDIVVRDPLTVALAWTDTAATPEAEVALVNDLDLELISPDGNRFRGNQLSGGQSRPNPPEWDERNVEEICRLYSPMTGRWTARVYGRNVFTERQPYALVVRNAPTGLHSGISESGSGAPVVRSRLGARWPFRLPFCGRLSVYATDGRQVTELADASSWDGLDRSGRRLGKGVYYYRITGADGRVASGKLVVVR